MKLISDTPSTDVFMTPVSPRLPAADINVILEDQSNLMIVSVRGELTSLDILEFAYVVYVQNPRPFIIWDISKGSLASTTVDKLVELAKQMTKFRVVEKGKTALIANSDLDFKLMQTYSVHAESLNKKIKYEVFHTMEKARKWLFKGNDKIT